MYEVKKGTQSSGLEDAGSLNTRLDDLETWLQVGIEQTKQRLKEEHGDKLGIYAEEVLDALGPYAR
ncbi:MAG: hypothetical protein QNI91_07995 [Arenicellales bacterium]|nr:hypothetical protein [Arenicellales bacterium]